MSSKSVVGYCDPVSVAPGDTVRFRVSCYAPGPYRADLVRTVCGDVSPVGGGFREEPVASAIDGEYPGREQSIEIGSWIEVPEVPGFESFSFQVVVWPTTPAIGVQSILRLGSREGPCPLELRLDRGGELVLAVGGEELASGSPLAWRRWCRVHVSYDGASGEAVVKQDPLPFSPGDDARAQGAEVRRRLSAGLLAGAPAPLFLADGRYNGRLEAPRLASRPLDPGALEDLNPEHPDLVGCWDFSLDIPLERVSDVSTRGLDGVTVNLPTRAVPGSTWTGEEHAWERAPDQYAAIHFHEDDLVDAGWEADFELEIPRELPSGIYAVRLRHGDSVDHVQFFVRAPRGRPRSDVLLLIPTASYLAYANHTVHLSGVLGPVPDPLLPNDATLVAHPEYGLSLYDYHADGSGVVFSSQQRPIMNLKSTNAPWQFTADTRITAWLETLGHSCDVLTDEDLHREGVEALASYRVVLTGTHPEYYSTRMLDSIEAYLHGGGRLMYLGGNGFYWRIAFHPTRPGVIEVRRAEDGTRAWIAEPGEYYHAFTGEYGGLWRRLGRPPQRLVGVGFAAQGFDGGTYYRRQDASRDPRVDFVWKGIDGETIGDHGRFDSAAGEEIDRFDAVLGSPRHACVMASSENHTRGMLRTAEEFLMTLPWHEDPDVRADLVFFECPNGGAVFSTGSIAWASALATNGYANDVSRLTANVLERFLDPTPFEVS